MDTVWILEHQDEYWNVIAVADSKAKAQDLLEWEKNQYKPADWKGEYYYIPTLRIREVEMNDTFGYEK